MQQHRAKRAPSLGPGPHYGQETGRSLFTRLEHRPPGQLISLSPGFLLPECFGVITTSYLHPEQHRGNSPSQLTTA